MPTKTHKIESPEKLQITRTHHAKSYGLTVDRNTCMGCELCSLICPREAITITKKVKEPGKKAQRPTIDVDKEKCQYCGICTAICPYGAVNVNVDDSTIASVVDKESFPELIRDIAVDTTKCPDDCKDCEDACPLDLIKVTSDPQTGRTTLEIEREKCPCCRICEVRCPKGAIQVRKIFTGRIRINQNECPDNCQDCLQVCPITDALYISEKDNKVQVNESYCVYCGLCRIVCPEEKALELSRSTIRHTQVRSGAWNKALEKLTSTAEMTKELRGKGKKKTMDAVEKLLIPKKDKK